MYVTDIVHMTFSGTSCSKFCHVKDNKKASYRHTIPKCTTVYKKINGCDNAHAV